jgi:hypothetical protein
VKISWGVYGSQNHSRKSSGFQIEINLDRILLYDKQIQLILRSFWICNLWSIINAILGYLGFVRVLKDNQVRRLTLN